MVQFGLAGRGLVEIERAAQFHQRGMVSLAASGVEQQLAGRFLGGIDAGEPFPVHQMAAGFAHHAGERLPQTGGGSQCAVTQRLDHPLRHPQHPLHGLAGGLRQQGAEVRGKGGGVRRHALIGPCVHRSGQRVHGAGGVRTGAFCSRHRRQVRWHRPVQVRRKQHAFAQPGSAARRTQFVEQRQQHDRDVPVPALQPLKIVGQQHGAAHQGGAGDIAPRHLVRLQRPRQLLHFLGDHRRGIQFHHAQGALHLVQVTRAEAHATGVGRVFDKGFDFKPGLAQGFVQLRLDPAQRGVVDRVTQRHRHGASLPGHTLSLLHSMPMRIISVPAPAQTGSLKSATERRRSAASCARLPIDSAVWLAPCEVWAVMDWMVSIVWVMLEAASDCWRAALEMP